MPMILRRLITGALAMVSLAGLDGNVRAASAVPTVWMINVKALRLIAGEPGGADLIAQFFNNPNTYVMAPRDQLALVPPRAVAVVNFPSFAGMRAAFGAGRVDARYGAVLYDCEAWNATPLEEQKNPVYYYGLAAELVHSHRLKLIAAPATTLRKVLLQPTGPGTYPPFMRTGIVGPIAKVSDIFEIQSQGLLQQTDKYADLVANAAKEARAANPKIIFLAGLSTNPSGRTVTAADLRRATDQTRSLVEGYWLNIPEKSEFCEACEAAHPAIATIFLRQLHNNPTP